MAVKEDASKDQAKALATARRNLLVHKRPITTLVNFFTILLRFLFRQLKELVHHPYFLLGAVPLAAAWFMARHVDGPHMAVVDEVETWASFAIWWVLLGVLSSVGMGTGMHSGLLFLWPHVWVVAKSAEHCNHLNFDRRHNAWYHILAPTDKFACVGGEAAASAFDINVTFMGLYWMVWLEVFLWGAGTAIGELPPYATSYAAAAAGEEDEEFAELEAEGNATGGGAANAVAAMKKWMVTFLQKHGFWGVFLMAAWPNALFDLCGICCGHFMMPFWSFFSAVFLGKALVKSSLQLVFFVALFSKSCFDQLYKLSVFVGTSFGMSEEQVAKKLHDSIAKFSGDQEDDGHGHGTNWVGLAFQLIITVFILLFLKSVVEQFAQQYQKELDEVALRKDGKEEKKDTKKTK